jgi:hypothetical protein
MAPPKTAASIVRVSRLVFNVISNIPDFLPLSENRRFVHIVSINYPEQDVYRD